MEIVKTLSKEQGELLKIAQSDNCIVDAGRQWGKTYMSACLAFIWDFENIIVVEPNGHRGNIFIDVFKQNFGYMIKHINHSFPCITLKNDKSIYIFSTKCDLDSWIGRKIEGVIFDEYSFSSSNHVKRVLKNIPGDARVCFLTTPIGKVPYLVRKYIFTKKSFHYFRFSTPKEYLPKDLIHGDLINKYTGYIPSDPITDNVSNLTSLVLSFCNILREVKTDIARLDSIIEAINSEIEKIDEVTL